MGKQTKSLADRFRAELLLLTGGRFAHGLVVACSGGADSTCLLHLSLTVSSELGWPLFVAHLDHGLRGEAAARDRRAVESVSAGLKLPFYWEKVDCAALARRESRSVEEAARQARYAFLEKIRAQTGADFILTGHNADDQAEAVLLNLLRGAGPKGLAGIPKKRGTILRPLLNFKRREIIEYLNEKSLAWVEDQSNQEPAFTRNRIRLELLPRLEQDYNPAIKEILNRTANILREEEEFWEHLVQSARAGVGWELDQHWVLMNRAALSGTAPALARRLVRSAVEALRGHTLALTLEHVDKVIEFNNSPGRGEISLPEGLKAWVEADRLCLGHPRALAEMNFSYKLDCPGETRIPELEAVVAAAPLEPGQRVDPREYVGDRAVLDLNLVRPPLTVRNPRPGDRFQPLGLKGTKKLSDLFIDEKVPAARRPRMLLVLDELGIIWVSGLRPAHRVRLTPGTKQVLVLSVKSES